MPTSVDTKREKKIESKKISGLSAVL